MKVIITFLGNKETDTVFGVVRNVDRVIFDVLYNNELIMIGKNIDVEYCIKDHVRKVSDVCFAHNVKIFKISK